VISSDLSQVRRQSLFGKSNTAQAMLARHEKAVAANNFLARKTTIVFISRDFDKYLVN
jgi:hypothetical protein